MWQNFSHFREKMKKKTVFSEKSEKKSKLALNLLPKISILKYKGKRMPTSELRNPPKLKMFVGGYSAQIVLGGSNIYDTARSSL